jgi:hypothetical protein
LSSENRGAATAGINKPKAKKNAELQRQLVLSCILTGKQISNNSHLE